LKLNKLKTTRFSAISTTLIVLFYEARVIKFCTQVGYVKSQQWITNNP